MKKKKKTKAKLKEKTLTLEEVFNQVALAPPSVSRTHIVLTPLSSEACLAKGINPDALQKREFETFRHDSSDLEIQRLKYEAYDKRRHELMETALKEKARLSKKVKKIDEGEDGSIAYSESPSLTPSGIMLQQEKANATLLEMEEKRLRKAREKQKKELLQLLQFEQKMDKVKREMQLKAEKDALAEERKKAKKKKQERRQAEERRVRELRRKAKEDAEEEIHRLNMRQRFEKEIQIKKEKEKQELEAKRRQRQLEEERERKREIQRIQVERLQLRKRREVEKKIEERNHKERERQHKIEKKREMDQHELDLKRKEAAKRIAMNKEAAQQHEEERKKVVMDKMARNQQQQEYIASLREHERNLNKKEREAMSRKREYQAQLAKERELEVKDFLLNKFHEDEKKVAMIQSMKEKEMALLKEERELNTQLKRDNVERIKRMQEYKRLETMRKINENDMRTEEMLKTKQELAKARRKNAVQAKIKRDKLMQILEKSKTSGGKAIKKILAQLENDEEVLGTSTKKSKSPMDSPANKPQQKRVVNKSSSDTKHPAVIEIGPPPEAPSLTARVSNFSQQRDYISPYASTRQNH